MVGEISEEFCSSEEAWGCRYTGLVAGGMNVRIRMRHAAADRRQRILNERPRKRVQRHFLFNGPGSRDEGTNEVRTVEFSASASDGSRKYSADRDGKIFSKACISAERLRAVEEQQGMKTWQSHPSSLVLGPVGMITSTVTK